MKQPEHSFSDHEQIKLDSLARAVLEMEHTLITRDLTWGPDRLRTMAELYLSSGVHPEVATHEMRKMEAQYERDKPFLVTSEHRAEWVGLVPMRSLDILAAELTKDSRERLQWLYAHKSSGRDRTQVHDNCALEGCDTYGVLDRSCVSSGICPAKTVGYVLTQELTGLRPDSTTYAPIDTMPYVVDPQGRYNEAIRAMDLAVAEGFVDEFYAAGLRNRYEEWWDLQGFVKQPQ